MYIYVLNGHIMEVKVRPQSQQAFLEKPMRKEAWHASHCLPHLALKLLTSILT